MMDVLKGFGKVVDAHVASHIHSRLLRESAKTSSLRKGRETHGHMIKTEFHSNIIALNHLVNMYAKCSDMVSARNVFDKMFQRNIVSWTAVITGYAQNGHQEESLRFFCQMHRAGMKANEFALASVIGSCATLGYLEQGEQVHAHAMKYGFAYNPFVGSAVIDMYAKCSSVKNACQAFDEIPERNLVIWNAVISGCGRNGHHEETLGLFCEMQLAGIKPDHFTFASILKACAGSSGLNQGKQIHLSIVKCGFESDGFVASTLIDMYGKCGVIEDACKVFDKMPERSAVSWNSMISGFVQNRCLKEAATLFREMPMRDAISWNVIIAGFAQHGHYKGALELFHQMPKPDAVTWNAIIAGYAQNGHGDTALKCFCQMHQEGIMQDQFSFTSALQSCASIGAFEQGKSIHGHIIKSGSQSDVFVASALVDMYAKCGSIENAQKMFAKMAKRNVISWNALIGGYAHNGYGKEALELFEEMQLSGLEPDNITFIGVLAACSHRGLVAKGLHYFGCMSQDHGITPSVEHFSCVVDLLGRAGHLDEAENFLEEKMPMEFRTAGWRALLGACRVHRNVELGKVAAQHILDLEPHDDATYVLLSNLYAAEGRWHDVDTLRRMMKDSRVKKQPGCSWIEVNKRVHTFFVGE